MYIGSREAKKDALAMGLERSPKIKNLLRAGRFGNTLTVEDTDDVEEEKEGREEETLELRTLLLTLDKNPLRSMARYSSNYPSINALYAADKRAICPRVSCISMRPSSPGKPTPAA